MLYEIIDMDTITLRLETENRYHKYQNICLPFIKMGVDKRKEAVVNLRAVLKTGRSHCA